MTLPFDIQIALGVAVLVALACSGLLRRQLLRQRHLPPGPRPWPILGNIPQMTLEFPEKRFAQWREKYGDVIFLKMFNTPVLVLNSVLAARELLDKRSAKYSERPHSILTVDMLGWEHDIGLIPYSEEFRKHRRWMHTHFFAKSSLDAIADVQQKETMTLLSGLLQDPESFNAHVHRYAASSMLNHLYGHEVQSSDDEYLHIIEAAVEETMSSSAPGASLVDFLPFLQYLPSWLPGAGFKRRAAEVRKTVTEAAQRTYALAATKCGDHAEARAVLPSLINEFTTKGTLDAEQQEVMMFGISVYSAGTDTTQTVIMALILAMVLYPDAFAKARAEIDRVIGCERLPTVEDKEALPYLECVLKEVYRFASPAPLAAPHATCEDDEYRGYWIPKGTTVIPNVWLMLHDAETYPDPDTFCPERFDGVHANQEDPQNIVFGFGRRICPGRRFADTGVWQVMATMIATLDVSKPRDAAGNEITPAGTFSSGFINHPHKFQCSITPRSEQAVALIINARAI